MSQQWWCCAGCREMPARNRGDICDECREFKQRDDEWELIESRLAAGSDCPEVSAQAGERPNG